MIVVFHLENLGAMNSTRPPLPASAHFATPARRTNTFQGGQRPVQLGKLASSTNSLAGNETPPHTKTHLFSPSVRSQSPSSSSTGNDHLLKYDVRRLRASLERKEEQISWWMEKSRADNDKFEALKAKFEQANRQHDVSLQCLRSTFDGLNYLNRSMDVVFLDEDKENESQTIEPIETFDEPIDENFSLVLLSRLNEICVKLTKNVDRLLRSSCPAKVSHPVQRHESNASSISKQSVEELQNSSVYEETIEKLTVELDLLKTKLNDEENRTNRLDDELNRCKSAQLTAKIHFDTQEKKLQDQLLLKDKQLMSIVSNEHGVLRQLLDEKTQAFEQLTEDFHQLMTKYESEYNRNVDCMIKTDALHDHIRLLSGALAEKEINEEKLTTQQQQMKKLMTLLVPSTPSLTTAKKLNEKKTFGRKVKRHLRESFSSLVNHKSSANGTNA